MTPTYLKKICIDENQMAGDEVDFCWRMELNVG